MIGWIALSIGSGLLVLILWGLRSEEADPLWFFDFHDFFDVSRSEHPLLYWFAIITQMIFAFGLIAFGVLKLM